MLLSFVYLLLFVAHLFLYPPALYGIVMIACVATLLALIRKNRDVLLHLLVLALALATLWSQNTAFFKFYPLSISLFMLLFFVSSTLKDRKILEGYYERFAKKKLTPTRSLFLLKSQKFWIVVLGINVCLQLFFLGESDALWSFYVLVGWYMLFAAALLLNIAYGKVFNTEVAG